MSDRRSSPSKRLTVALGGGSVVLLGVIMMPLPGPGTLVVLVGLSILRREFAWAARLSDRIRDGSTATARLARRVAGRQQREP